MAVLTFDVLSDVARHSGGNPLSQVRPVSCPVDPLRRFVGGSTHAPAAEVADLCRLVEWAYGYRDAVVEGQRATRRAPSAGALYPIEVLLVSNGLVAYYDFSEHRLHALNGTDPSLVARRLGLGPSQHGVLLAAVVWRTVQRYGTRGYRYCLLDAAQVAANFAAAATSTGYRVAPAPCQPDPSLDKSLGLRRDELGMLALSVTPGPLLRTVPDPLSRAPIQRRTSPATEHPPLLSPALQRVVWLHGRCADSARHDGRPWRPAVPGPDKLFELLDLRFSARDFTGAAVPEDDIRALAAAGAAAMRSGFDADTPSLRLTSIPMPVVSGSPVRHDRLAAACQGQGVVARSAAAFVLSVDGAQVRNHGHPGYRRAVVNAGLVTAQLYRAAAARGVATTTVGGFTDAEIAKLIGDDDAHPIVIQVFGQSNHTAPKVDAPAISAGRTKE